MFIEDQSIENARLKRASALDQQNKNRTVEPREEIQNLCLNTDGEDDENEEDKVF